MHCSQNEITTNVCIWEISCNLLALVEFHFRFNAPHQVPQVISSSKSQDACSAHACNDQGKHEWEEMTWHLIDNFMRYKAIDNRYCCLHKKITKSSTLTERQPVTVPTNTNAALVRGVQHDTREYTPAPAHIMSCHMQAQTMLSLLFHVIYLRT